MTGGLWPGDRRPDWKLVILLLQFPVLFAVLAGCGDGRPGRVPVSGQVLIDRQPLTYGHVRFVPEGARPSGGRLGADGRFTLTCYDGEDGAVPGRHRVEVSAGEPLEGGGIRWHAPKKYNRYATSGLDVDVDGPTDSLSIELTWDGGEPFVEKGEPEW